VRPLLEGSDTLASHSTVKVVPYDAQKIQIGQLWKKNGTNGIYLVTPAVFRGP